MFFFSSRRRHTIWTGDWSSDVCSSDLLERRAAGPRGEGDGVGIGIQEALRAPDLVPDETAVGALALSDEEARRAAKLLRDAVRDLREVVEVEAQVVRPGAGLRATVLDDLQVCGPVRRAAGDDLVTRAAQESLDDLTADGVERPVLAGRRDDRPPR